MLRLVCPHTVAPLVVLLISLCSAENLTEKGADIEKFFGDGPTKTVNVRYVVQDLVNDLTDRLKCVHYGLRQSDCSSCLKTEKVLRLLQLDPSNRLLTNQDVVDISTVLLHHVLFFRTSCRTSSPGCTNYTLCRQQVYDEMIAKNSLESLENILRHMKSVLEITSSKECFSAEMILSEVEGKAVNSEDEKMGMIIKILMRNVFQGRCIDVGESITDFLDSLFHLYGDKCSSNINISGLKRIMQDLQANSIGGHDHGAEGHSHEHDHDHDHSHEHEKDKEDCKNYFEKLSYIHHEHPHNDHNHGNHEHNHDDHDHDHDEHNQSNHDHHSPDHRDHNHDHSDDGHHNHDHHFHGTEDHHYHHANFSNSTQDSSGHSHHNSSSEDVIPHKHDEVHHTYKTYPITHNTSEVKPGSNDSVLRLTPTDPLTIVNLGDRPSPPSTIQDLSTNGSELEVVYDDIRTVSAVRSEFLHHEENVVRRNSIPFRLDNIQRVYLHDNQTKESVLEHQLESHQHGSLASKCFSVEELMSQFGHVSNGSLTKLEFLHLCPALVQQIVSGVCQTKVPREKAEMTMWELYGYSTLAVLIISLTSLAGVVLLPVLAKQAYYYIMAGCIGLAFSTLAGDALLHLIPQAMGLHSHDEDTHSHEDDKGFGDPIMWKQAAVFFSIYLLYLFEATVCMFSKSKSHSHSHGSNGHGHSHIPDALPKEMTLVSIKVKSDSNVQLAMSPDRSSSLDTEIAENDAPKKPKEPVIDAPSFCGLTTVALLVTLGDSIHNFGDGLAIGAAFSSGIRSGLSTAIAVFCHELPHEFGDFVILLSSGLSFSKALWINFLSGLTCLIGLYIGIQLGVNQDARNWILTVTAGIFLYVALTEMLPELKEGKQGNPAMMLLVKNIGILSGFAMMILLSVYEHQFNF